MNKEAEKALPTIADDLVVTKYKMAAEIVNRVLKDIASQCTVGQSVRDLCKKADMLITGETDKAFKKDKNVQKGVAFPCCISVNNCLCHYSPLAADADTILKEGDLAKIDLGAHIDGYIAVVAHTVVIGGDTENSIVNGRKADVLLAAHYAQEAALRLIKPGNETYSITDTVQKIAESYKCKPIEGWLSHQLEQNIIDGEKEIIQNPNESQRKEMKKYEFETNEVYAIDILISTGEGQGRDKDGKSTVYKKTDQSYMLKMKNSREFYSTVQKKFGSMPFNLRSFDNETKAKMGVVECVTHQLVEPLQVLYEKDSEFVAQFKFTVLLMPNGPHKITGLPFDPSKYTTTNSIEDTEIQTLLKTSANPKSGKKKKAAKKAAASEATGALVGDTSTKITPDVTATTN